MTDIDVQATKHVHMYQLLYQLLVIILQLLPIMIIMKLFSSPIQLFIALNNHD